MRWKVKSMVAGGGSEVGGWSGCGWGVWGAGGGGGWVGGVGGMECGVKLRMED